MSIQSFSRLACFFAVCAVVVAACGGGSSGGGSGSLTLGITDTPVDDATSVVVTFHGVDLIGGDEVVDSFDFDPPRAINLLALQGGNVAALIVDETVPAMEYEQIRLRVDALDVSSGCKDAGLNSSPTFLTLDPVPSDDPQAIIDSGVDRHPLCIPSSSNTGLKLVSGFTVPQGGSADFTIDFDLRKAVTEPSGTQYQSPQKYLLRPALRLIDNVYAGHIAGTVDESLLDEAADGCSDDDPLTGNAVYVFEGSDVVPDDIDGVDGPDAEPITVATVEYDADSDEYRYFAAFLPEGPYTVAFTCQADQDSLPVPEDSNDGDDTIAFVAPANVAVIADETTEHNFAP